MWRFGNLEMGQLVATASGLGRLGENGYQFTALLDEIGKPSGFHRLRFRQEFEPVQGFVGLSDNDSDGGNEVFFRGSPKSFAIVRTNGSSRFQNLSPQHIPDAVPR